jgi:UDP-N-acetylglucosamine--N-acetylmuramyl-(pentapeptide) pyrophosphoryl-undecaprenol N-acetylglucosamine transferase
MKKKYLFVVAAGSGGHILPALCLAQQWKQENPDGTIVLFTGNGELEKKIVKKHANIQLVFNWGLTKFSRKNAWKLPWLLLQMLMIFFKSCFYSLWYRPEKVITTGGILAIPLCIAAWLTRKPVDVYELNVLPGKAVKALFPFARKLYIAFPQTKAYCHWGKIKFDKKCQETSFPLRFTPKDKDLDKATIISRINVLLQQRHLENKFNASRKTLFILGGSQGSVLLNNLIKGFVLHQISLKDQMQIIHQTGAFEETGWESWYTNHNLPALTFSYDEHINQFYILADVIVCRAGAGTMFEIAFFGKRCIVIPLVAATTDHQIYNAQAMAEQHPTLFTVLSQEEVAKNPEKFYKILNNSLLH